MPRSHISRLSRRHLRLNMWKPWKNCNEKRKTLDIIKMCRDFFKVFGVFAYMRKNNLRFSDFSWLFHWRHFVGISLVHSYVIYMIVHKNSLLLRSFLRFLLLLFLSSCINFSNAQITNPEVSYLLLIIASHSFNNNENSDKYKRKSSTWDL